MLLESDDAGKHKGQSNTELSQETATNEAKKLSCELSKLLLKKFSGDPAAWISSWDTFESAVGKNPQLAEIDKFNYLNGQLEGKAVTIAGFLLSTSNYKQAVQLLKERYANPQLIISSHVERLLKLQTVTDADANDTPRLRTLYDKIEKNTCSLHAMDIKPEQFGSLLVPVVLAKYHSSATCQVVTDILARK